MKQPTIQERGKIYAARVHQEPIKDDYEDEQLFERDFGAWDFMAGEATENYIAGATDQQTIDEERMIAFAEWCTEQKWYKIMKQGYNDDGTLKVKTTAELLQIFKTQE